MTKTDVSWLLRGLAAAIYVVKKNRALWLPDSGLLNVAVSWRLRGLAAAFYVAEKNRALCLPDL